MQPRCFLPAAHAQSVWLADLHFLCLCACIHLGLCIPTYHMHINYIAYIIAVQVYFSWLWKFGWLLCVATMSSLAQLWVQDRYQEAEATQTWPCEADREWKCQKRAATCDAYRAANWLRMAARRALKWIRMLKVQTC